MEFYQANQMVNLYGENRKRHAAERDYVYKLFKAEPQNVYISVEHVKYLSRERSGYIDFDHWLEDRMHDEFICKLSMVQPKIINSYDCTIPNDHDSVPISDGPLAPGATRTRHTAPQEHMIRV